VPNFTLIGANVSSPPGEKPIFGPLSEINELPTCCPINNYNYIMAYVNQYAYIGINLHKVRGMIITWKLQ